MIQNAASLDYLLSNYTALISNLSNINDSLNTLSTSYDSFQTTVESYNTSNLVIPYLSAYTSIVVLSYVTSGFSILVGTLIIAFIILILTKQKSPKMNMIVQLLLFSVIIMSSVTCIYYLLEGTAFKYISTLY